MTRSARWRPVATRGTEAEWLGVGPLSSWLRFAARARPGRVGESRVRPDRAFERYAIGGAVEMSEHVVEGPVLEQHNNDVVERARAAG
jgi:hypothetical protein